MHYRAARYRSGRREAWRRVTWQPVDSYSVDGDERVFDDPVDAIHLAEERGVLARRRSDGAPLNWYYPSEET